MAGSCPQKKDYCLIEIQQVVDFSKKNTIQ